MIDFNKLFKIENIIIIFILLSFIHLFNGFENTYKIIKRSYEARMQITHGYCQNDSYGFYSEMVEKFKINDFKVVQENYEGYPLFRGFFYKKDKKIDEKFYLLLNYNKSIFPEVISVEGKKILLKDLDLLFKKKNCYLFKLKK
jgi:hypothetical protein